VPTHQENLKIVNDAVLPKFHSREHLKNNLANVTDPVIQDEIKCRLEDLRNEIICNVIGGLKDMLQARASCWRKSLCDDVVQISSHTPKWYLAIKPDVIMSFIYENLLEAVERYDPYRKPFCKFTSFFWAHNDNMLKNQHKKLYADCHDISKTYSLNAIDENYLDKGINQTEEVAIYPFQDARKCRGHRRLHPNLMLSEVDMENQLYNNMVLREILQRISSRKEKHIVKRLLLGYSQAEIAKKMKCSGTSISTTIKNIAIRCEDLIY